MSKAPVDIIKYIIHAEVEANGLIEKPDLIGAIFGQTEGLLGEDLDLRELQKSGRIGRIDAELKTKDGVTRAKIKIPSSLDMVETSIIAAGVETITRVGPCDAKFRIVKVEDVREDKRKAIVERARNILKTFMSSELPDVKEITEELREDVREEGIVKLKGLDAGPAVATSDNVIIVEGRADVLNLLRNGVKNAIAVGGIKIPPEIEAITRGKTVTAFVDGDRGGDLILKSLKNAGVYINYVARAPVGREVEGLTRKELIMALRKKRPADEVFSELSKEASGASRQRETRRTAPTKKATASEGKSVRRGSRSTTRDHRVGRREIQGRSQRTYDQRDKTRLHSRNRGSESSRPSQEELLLEKLSGLKKEALLLDENLKEIKRVPLENLKKTREVKKAVAVIVDDIINNDLLDLAKNSKYIVGITTAGDLRPPEGKSIVTKF